MSAIKVTSEDLHRVSGNLASGSQDVETRLHSMEGQVNGLIGAEWQGAASSAFHELWEQWHRGAKDVKAALDGISRMLGKAGATYQETEDQIATQLRG